MYLDSCLFLRGRVANNDKQSQLKFELGLLILLLMLTISIPCIHIGLSHFHTDNSVLDKSALRKTSFQSTIRRSLYNVQGDDIHSWIRNSNDLYDIHRIIMNNILFGFELNFQNIFNKWRIYPLILTFFWVVDSYNGIYRNII